MTPEHIDPHEAANFASTIEEMDVGCDIGNGWADEQWNCLGVRNAEGRLISYMVGKQQDASCYFIWLCATLPEARGQGCAKALLTAHEAIACSQDCEWSLIDSKNKYPAMIITLVKSGYKIWRVKERESDDRHSIQFRKSLANKALERTPLRGASQL